MCGPFNEAANSVYAVCRMIEWLKIVELKKKNAEGSGLSTIPVLSWGDWDKPRKT